MKKYLIVGLVLGTLISLSAQGTGTPNQLRVLTDANNYLMAVGVAQTNPISQPTLFSNTRLRTDANNYLQVVITGGAVITGGTCTNQVVTAISVAGVPTCTTVTSAYVDSSIAQVAAANLFTATQTITKSALGTTSTDGLILQNTTASTVGTPVQISPRGPRLSGTAYNSISTLSETESFFTENLPITIAGTITGTYRIGFINNAGTVTYPLTLSSAGALVSTGGISAGLNVTVNSGQAYVISSRALWFGGASDGLMQFTNSGNSAGIGLDLVTDAVMKVRTRAQTGYATVDALAYTYSGNTLSSTTGSIGGGILVAGACTSGTVAITGSTTTMTVIASPNTYPGDGVDYFGYVSTNGTVTVKVCAIVGLTPTASTYNVRVQP